MQEQLAIKTTETQHHKIFVLLPAKALRSSQNELLGLLT